MHVSAARHSRGASVSMPWLPLSRHVTLACSLTTTVASPLKSTSTSYLPPQSNTGQHVRSGSSASRERAYSSGMPRMATSVNPATNTPATTAVMVTVAVAGAGAGAGRGSTGGLEVSQIVSAARDVGVQDVPLLPEPASWKGVRGGGAWAGDAAAGRRTTRELVWPWHTAAAWARPRTAPAKEHGLVAAVAEGCGTLRRRALTATRFFSSTAVHTRTNSRPRYFSDA